MKPILATIIFAEELSEERGPQAIIGEAEQSDAISTGATCACILEMEQFRNNNIGEELQYNTSDFLEISMFNDYMYLSRGKTQDYGSEPSGCTHWL